MFHSFASFRQSELRLVHLIGIRQHELRLVVAQVFEGSDAKFVKGRAKLLKITAEVLA